MPQGRFLQPEKRTIRIVIADDHTLITDGMAARLATVPDTEICEIVSDGQAALDACITHQPDIVFLDIGLPKMNGIEAAMAIKRAAPDIEIIAVTGSDDHLEILKMMQAGASACIYKGTQFDLAEIINTIQRGYAVIPKVLLQDLIDSLTSAFEPTPQARQGVDLTTQEKTILQELVDGYSNKEIAFHLDITTGTVKAHLTNIYRKLNVRTRTEVVKLVLSQNLIDPGEE